MLALALTLHILQPQFPHLRKPTLLADDAPIAPPPVQMLAPSAAQAAPPDLHVAPKLADPLAGSFSFAEFGLGSLGVLATTVAFGLAASQQPAQHDETLSDVLAVIYVLVAPVVASAIAWGWASPDAAGSFAKALLRAGLVEVVGVAVSFGFALLIQTEAAAAVTLIALGVIEFIGVPLAASFGMHAGESHPAAAPPTETIRSQMPPVARAISRPQTLAFGFHF